jgi:hypothetical protein
MTGRSRTWSTGPTLSLRRRRTGWPTRGPAGLPSPWPARMGIWSSPSPTTRRLRHCQGHPRHRSAEHGRPAGRGWRHPPHRLRAGVRHHHQRHAAGAQSGSVGVENMSVAYRTVNNPGTGETITFVETSEDTGGARVVALITLAPGGAIAPHSHRITETFECVEGARSSGPTARREHQLSSAGVPEGASRRRCGAKLAGRRHWKGVLAGAKVRRSGRIASWLHQSLRRSAGGRWKVRSMCARCSVAAGMLAGGAGGKARARPRRRPA